MALKKFIQTHPESMSGVELELSGVNPQAKWALLQTERKKRVLRVAPELAQTKYLAAQTDTDLDGTRTVGELTGGKLLDQHAEPGRGRGRRAITLGCAGHDPERAQHTRRIDQSQCD